MPVQYPEIETWGPRPEFFKRFDRRGVTPSPRPLDRRPPLVYPDSYCPLADQSLPRTVPKFRLIEKTPLSKTCNRDSRHATTKLWHLAKLQMAFRDALSPIVCIAPNNVTSQMCVCDIPHVTPRMQPGVRGSARARGRVLPPPPPLPGAIEAHYPCTCVTYPNPIRDRTRPGAMALPGTAHPTPGCYRARGYTRPALPHTRGYHPPRARGYHHVPPQG